MGLAFGSMLFLWDLHRQTIWPFIFGLGMFYLIILQFMLVQDYNTLRGVLIWIDPELANNTQDEKNYCEDCGGNFSWLRLWSEFDGFAMSHFFSYIARALILRHYG